MTTTTLAFDIIGRDKSASSTFDKVGKSAEGAGSKVKSFGKFAAAGLAAAGLGAVAAGTYVFNYGAKLEQMEAKAKTVFGSQLGLVNKWAKANAHAMGLTNREATGLAANFADLLIPMGFTRNEAAKMSTKVVGLSGALSQWSGGTKSAAEVTDILNSAMLGETDGLKALGISISAADVQAELLRKGQDKLTGASRQQAEAQAVQKLIFEKSTDAQAAFAKGGSPLLSAQMKLKATFGEVRDTLVSKLVPAMSNMATWFVSKGLPALQKFGGELKDKFGPIIGKLVGWFKDDVLPALEKVWAQALPAVQKAFDSVKKALSNAQPYFELLGKILVNVLLPVLGKVASIVLPLLGKGLEIFGKALGVVAGIVTKFASAFLLMGEFGVKAFRLLLTAAFATFGGILDAAAAGLGWIPGIGDKIKGARDAFEDFGDKTIAKLKGVEDSLHRTRDAINRLDGKHASVTVDLHVNDAAVKGHYGPMLEGLDRTSGRTGGFTPRGVAGRATGGPLAGLVAAVESGKIPLQKAFDKVATVVERAKSKLADLLSQRGDLAGQFSNFTSSAFSADLSNPETGAAPTAGSLVTFQRSELAKAQRLKRDVNKLLKMGLSKDLIQQMAASGESGIAQIHALAAGSSAQVHQLNALNSQTQAALDAAGMAAGNAVYGAQIDQAKAAQATALEVRKQLEEWRKEEQDRNDRNTILQVNLTGRTIRFSLLELKRKNGGAALGLA